MRDVCLRLAAVACCVWIAAVAVAAPSASAQPASPESGAVLYEADWAAYGVPPSLRRPSTTWRVENDALVGTGPWLVAMPTLPSVWDYVIETQLQRLGGPDGAFGIVLWELARDRYAVEFVDDEVQLVQYRGGLAGGILPFVVHARAAFDPGGELHRYHARVLGNEFAVLADDSLILSAEIPARTAAVAPPRLYAQTELRIRSFRIVAL
jgi:hypothetical protein